MGTSTVPAGLRSSPHTHTNCESALYVLSGHGQFLAGQALERSYGIAGGDFIYVPPGAPHCVVNDGEEDLVLIRGVRTVAGGEVDPVGDRRVGHPR